VLSYFIIKLFDCKYVCGNTKQQTTVTCSMNNFTLFVFVEKYLHEYVHVRVNFWLNYC